MNKRIKDLFHELKHHLPFTALATAIGLAVFFIVEFGLNLGLSKQVFEAVHPLHVIVSGIGTAGIFYKYKKSIFQALLVGVSGSIIIGSLSDVLLPYLGALVLQLQPEFHLPIIKDPFTIVLASVVGSVFGISTSSTKTSHSLHVFLSVFASLFYLLAYTTGASLLYFVAAFAIVLIAVVVPCCLSDIIFPFLFLGRKIKTCNC
ncbi:MAG: hypothetical protein ABEJ02_01605 [Candidatus Paceibacteria bacterium]